MDLLYLKYFKGLIWYKDIQRIDEYIIPREACREILLNCINHKRYESNIPIQISVYNDKVYIWNDGEFPKEINQDRIYEKHISKPYNPLIAQTFFKAGFIESWGRGFEKIENEYKEFNCPLPDIKINEGGVKYNKKKH